MDFLIESKRVRNHSLVITDRSSLKNQLASKRMCSLTSLLITLKNKLMKQTNWIIMRTRDNPIIPGNRKRISMSCKEKPAESPDTINNLMYLYKMKDNKGHQ